MNNLNNKDVRIRGIDFDRAIQLINFEPVTIQKYNDLYTFTDIEEITYSDQINYIIKKSNKKEFGNEITIYQINTDNRKIIKIDNIDTRYGMKILNKYYDDIIITSTEDKKSILLSIDSYVNVPLENIYNELLKFLEEYELQRLTSEGILQINEKNNYYYTFNIKTLTNYNLFKYLKCISCIKSSSHEYVFILSNTDNIIDKEAFPESRKNINIVFYEDNIYGIDKNIISLLNNPNILNFIIKDNEFKFSISTENISLLELYHKVPSCLDWYILSYKDNILYFKTINLKNV